MITLQRHRRPLAAGRRRCATASASFNAEGTGDRARHRRHAGDAQPRAADVHHQPPGRRVLRRRSSRSPPSPRSRSTGCSWSSRPCATATTSCRVERRGRPDEHAAAADRPRGARRASACCSSRSSPSSGWRRSSRRRSRTPSTRVGAPQSAVGVVIALLVLLPETLAARAQRAPRPRADELQPRARLGDGEHRADDPGDRGRLDLARRPARARARRDADRPARDHRRRRRRSPSSRAGRRCRRAACTWCCSPRSCSSRSTRRDSATSQRPPANPEAYGRGGGCMHDSSLLTPPSDHAPSAGAPPCRPPKHGGAAERGSPARRHHRRRSATASATPRHHHRPAARRPPSSAPRAAGSTPRRSTRSASAGVVDIAVRGSSGSGTGFVVDKRRPHRHRRPRGRRRDSVTVKFQDGTTRKATVLGKDDATDIAVIKIDPSGLTLHPLTLGSSASVDVGADVAAIGDPFGYARSISTGIVSGVDRTIQAPNGFTVAHAIQTDAAMNPGNSGGPVLDADGNVIGIADQIATDGSADQSSGVGFAVPIDLVKSALNDARGRAARSSTPTSASPPATARRRRALSGVSGGGPAGDAGLRAGDVDHGVRRHDGGRPERPRRRDRRAPARRQGEADRQARLGTLHLTVTLGTQPARGDRSSTLRNLGLPWGDSHAPPPTLRSIPTTGGAPHAQQHPQGRARRSSRSGPSASAARRSPTPRRRPARARVRHEPAPRPARSARSSPATPPRRSRPPRWRRCRARPCCARRPAARTTRPITRTSRRPAAR